MNAHKFQHKPFIARDLRSSEFVYLTDDRLNKGPIAPRYMGPYKVISKNWQEGTFTINLNNRQDSVSINRLKPYITL